jgi:hypothetical protein
MVKDCKSNRDILTLLKSGCERDKALFHDLSLPLLSSFLLFISDLFISPCPKQMSATLSCGGQWRISPSYLFICLGRLRSPECGFSLIAKQCY